MSLTESVQFFGIGFYVGVGVAVAFVVCAFMNARLKDAFGPSLAASGLSGVLWPVVIVAIIVIALADAFSKDEATS